MTSQTIWAEILSQAEEDIKKVMADMQKVQRGEKHWLTLGDTSLPFFSDGPPGGRAMEEGGVMIPGSWDRAPQWDPHSMWSLLRILSLSPSAPLPCFPLK
uniref:Uncharacterized protein n=1 Tax=Panthera leo TaxID=9689 RepID=A0A8C9D892_PANLE